MRDFTVPSEHRTNFGDLGNRQVFKKMQDQNLAMPETDLTQGLVNRCRIFVLKRRLLGFLKIFKLHLLGRLPGYISANSIHRNLGENSAALPHTRITRCAGC